MESGRRASEVHKERTGRGLKVTEAAVTQDAMFVEEEPENPLNFDRVSEQLGQTAEIFRSGIRRYLLAVSCNLPLKPKFIATDTRFLLSRTAIQRTPS